MTDTTATSTTAAARRWWILIVICLAQLMDGLDVTIVNIALPHAQKDLGFTLGERQWIVTAYSLAFGSLLLLFGRISDILGRRTMLLLGLIGFAVASALGGAAPTFGLLVAARALQGAAGAAIAPAALSLLSTTFTDAKDRAKAFAIFGGISGSGAAVGMILGGILTQFLNWRFTLFVNVVIAIVAIIGAIALIPRHATAAPKPCLDVLGTVLVCVGLFSVVFGFANVEAQSWTSPGTWAFLSAGVLLLAVFVWWQTRTTHPLLPLRIILNRTRGGANLAIFVAGIGLFAAFLFLSYFMQQTLGFTPLAAGLAFLPMVVGIVIAGGIATTQLTPRFGPRVPISLGLLAAAGALVWLTGISDHSTYAANVLGPLILFGLGVGATIAPAMNAGTANTEPEDAGIASATVNIAQQIGGSIGTALLNSVAAAALTAYLIGTSAHSPAVHAAATIHSYTTAFWIAAAVFAAGAATCALIFHPPRNEAIAADASISEP